MVIFLLVVEHEDEILVKQLAMEMEVEHNHQAESRMVSQIQMIKVVIIGLFLELTEVS
jgi:hypothetical protein